MSEEIESLSNSEIEKDSFDEIFLDKLDKLSLELPEIAESRDIIEKGGKAIAQEFRLSPDLLCDEAHSLYFIAIAQRNGNLEQHREAVGDFDTYKDEKQFIFDIAALLALEKSEKYQEYKKQICSEEEVSPEIEKQVFEKYTNVEVTSEIRLAVEKGLLDDVKGRMGITAENEDPYQLKVLDVWGDYAIRHEMADLITPELEALPYTDPAWTEHYRKVTQYEDYISRLQNNGNSLKAELNWEDSVPLAWKTTIDGVTTLIIPLPLADKILHHEEKCLGKYSEDDLRRDKAILEHEYVHTQGGVLLSETSLIGVSAEELRAEHFSGNTQGYHDIKSAAMLINVIAGYDLVGDMESREKGGKIEDIFKSMAKNIGLQKTLEFGLITPGSSGYSNEQVSPIRAGVVKQLGGFDGYFKNMYEDMLKTDEAEIVNKRLIKVAEIISKPSKENAELYLNYMERINHMPYCASIIRSKLELLPVA